MPYVSPPLLQPVVIPAGGHVAPSLSIPVVIGQETPPPGDAVALDFGSAYTPPAGDKVALEFVARGDITSGGLIVVQSLAVGENINAELDVYDLIGASLLNGSTLAGELSTSDAVASLLGHGETATFALSTCPVITPSGLIVGQSLAADITTESTRADLLVGENVKAELDVYDLIASTLYNGAILAGELTTSAAFASLLGHGEALSASVEFHPAFYPYCSLSVGESIDAALATTTTYQCTLSLGESVIAVLDFRPGLELTAGLSCGESAFVTEIRVAPGLFPDAMGEGVSVVVASLDEELPWRLWTGVSTVGILETTAGFQGATAYDGQSVTGEVDVRPSQPISISFYHGESFLPERPYVQHRAYLSATIFVGQSPSACFEDMTVDFDLRGPIRLDTTDWFWNPDKFRAESEDLPAARGWGDGCGETVFAELSCRPRFSSTMATGESFRSERGYEFVESTLADSAVIPLNDPFYVEPLVPLCYPNLFPYADNIEVELEWEEIRCSSDFVYTGEAVHGSLGVWRRFAPTFYVGESFLPDFTPDPAMRCIIWIGCTLRAELATTYGIGSRLHDGVSTQVEFERESSYISAGESVMGNIDMTFYVEFAEVGCLDNEFIPINENGDPDISKRLPVCVEGYDFLHDLKARCY